MNTFITAFLFASAEAVVSLAASFALLWQARWVKRMTHYLLSLAAGALLGLAFLDLMSEALDLISAEAVAALVLAGIVASFLLEKLLVWYHCHDEHCERHAVRPLVIVGDSIHNFIDGIGIGVAVLAGTGVGAIATFAVILHEIPREGSDVAILLASGMRRRRVFVWTVCASLMTVVGAVAAVWLGGTIAAVTGPLLAVVAGTFIYIATADLIPELHRSHGWVHAVGEAGLFVLGILLVALPGYALGA
ncbi:ZIP family metal transporter [Candidatus Parcubacteria bacterium]|nr:ZIP family metal transporter [Candidatus Parcubacteria bacterium]